MASSDPQDCVILEEAENIVGYLTGSSDPPRIPRKLWPKDSSDPKESQILMDSHDLKILRKPKSPTESKVS